MGHAGLFKVGNSGKPKGTQNKVTGRAKELLVMAIDAQSDNFNSVMNQLRIDEPKEWAKLMVMLFKYVAPEKLDITTGGESINIPVISWVNGGSK